MNLSYHVEPFTGVLITDGRGHEVTDWHVCDGRGRTAFVLPYNAGGGALYRLQKAEKVARRMSGTLATIRVVRGRWRGVCMTCHYAVPGSRTRCRPKRRLC